MDYRHSHYRDEAAMTFYAIHATVTHVVQRPGTIDHGASMTRQVPTFFIDGNIQGCLSTDDAENVARRTLEAAISPGMEGHTTVHVVAWVHGDVDRHVLSE